VASLLEEKKSLIAAIEINVSCPNIKEGGIAFGTDLKLLSTVVSAIRRATTLPLITKLSPNVGKIANFAKAAVDSGSDILSLINTIPGLSINIETRKPRIANITGGLSGPAIKPIALRMIYETAQAVDAPIIGMGGISSPEDAIEFFLAGADAIAIGTVIFSEPDSPIKIIDGINSYLEGHNIKKLSDIVGKMEL
jgi:dihydroorotate dehydrogenase (NAD+) catalytic subunit